MSVYLRMNIHRHDKSGCEIAFGHFNNICQCSKFSIQKLEKLLSNGLGNRAVDSQILKNKLQSQGYRIKTLLTVYTYGLNQETKAMCTNKSKLNHFHHFQDKKKGVKGPQNIQIIMKNLNLDLSLDFS